MECDLKRLGILGAASGIMKGSHVTRQLTYGAETTANGWPDGRLIYHTMTESSIE